MRIKAIFTAVLLLALCPVRQLPVKAHNESGNRLMSVGEFKILTGKETSPLPDLVVDHVTVIDAFTVRVDVMNIGKATSNECTLTLYLFDKFNQPAGDDNEKVPALAPHQPPTPILFQSLGDEGIFGKRIQAKVDSKNQVKESNEANNWSRLIVVRK